MSTPQEALIAMREYLRRARHAGATLTQDPDGEDILRLVMRAEDRVSGWLLNAGALIEPVERTRGDSTEVGTTQIANVLHGLHSISHKGSSGWATADHIAERIGQPLDYVIEALNAAAARGYVESVYHYTLSYRGEQWLLDEGDFLLNGG